MDQAPAIDPAIDGVPGTVYPLEAMNATLARIRTDLVLTVILLTPLTAAAQDPWQYRTSAGEYAYAAGDLARAEAEFRGALDLAQRLPAGDPRLEISLSNLARLYENQRRLDEAQPLYQLLLAAQEARVGDADPELLDTLVAVARVSLASGDSPTAEDTLTRYLEVADASGQADPGQHWRMLGMLARIRSLAERHDESLDLQRRAVAVLADDPATGDLERAAELESLAQMELLHGSADAAEELLARVVELRAAAGAGTPAETYAAAASTALGAGEPEIAERLATRAVDSSRGTAPLSALEVLAEVSWLRVASGGSPVDLLGVGGNSEQLRVASERLERVVDHPSLAMREAHPELAETFARLAMVAALRGDAATSATWKRRQLDILQSLGGSLGGTSPAAAGVRGELVGLLAAAGRADQAAAENGRLISDLEAAWGATDLRLAPALEQQIELLTELGRKREAKALKKRLRTLGTQRR